MIATLCVSFFGMKKKMMIGLIKSLNVYFSGACNLNCSYCCIKNQQHIDNTKIQQALEDGSFTKHVKDALTVDTIALGIWGMEPSINGKYFRHFITEILNYSSYIKYIFIVTNGMSNTFFEHFILPLQAYTKAYKRKIKLWVQISLDGPQKIHDAHCGTGTYAKVYNNIKQYFHANVFETDYIKIRLSIKPTFRPQDWGNISQKEFIEWRNNLLNECEKYRNDHLFNMGLLIPICPTIEHGVNYTKEDGINFAKWEEHTNLEYRGCAAGKHSKAIDYLGNLYDCQLLTNNTQVMTNQEIRQLFEEKMNELVAKDEVIEQDRDKLFSAIIDNFCFAIDNYADLPNYIRLFGNGALLK